MTYWLAPLLLCLAIGALFVGSGFALGVWFARQAEPARTFHGSER